MRVLVTPGRRAVNRAVADAPRPLAWAWRLPLLAVALLYAVGPLWAVLGAETVPGWLLAALVALTAAASAWPAVAPAVLLGLVPLLPVLPLTVTGVPAALVHIVVLTQAVPVLTRLALRGRHPRGAPVFAIGWGLFVLVAIVSVGVGLTPDRLRGAALDQVWRDLASQVPSYVFAVRTTAEVTAIPLLVTLADGLLCALVVYATVTRETRWRYLAVAGVCAVATALFGFVQAGTGIALQSAWQVFDPGIVRINATYADPNALAAYYALVGPILLGLALSGAGWRRGVWGGAFFVVVAAMVMTAGRTGLVSLALGCTVLVWLGLRRHLDEVDPWAVIRTQGRRAARAALLAIVATVAVLTIVGTSLNVQHAQQTSYLHTWLYTLNLRQPVDAVAKGRVAVWQTTLAMVRDAPVTGMGLGMGVNEFERYRRALDMDTLPPDARLSAHNTFLLIAGDLGLLGLTAWLFMFGTVAYGIRQPGNLPAGVPATWPVLGLVAGLCALVITMLTGDRILLAEDIVVGTTCASLACVGATALPRRWRWLTLALALVVVASWPVRVATRAPDGDTVPSPRGLHAAQPGEDGETYRWTSGYAVIYLPHDTKTITLPVRNVTPSTVTLRVYLDGRLAEARELVHGPLEELTYEVPPNLRRGRWRRLTLEVTPTWHPPGDPRELGVLVGELQVARAENR